MTDSRISSDRAAVVAPEFHWLQINKDTPRGVRMLLINKSAGVAQIGVLHGDGPFYTHWAPLPTWRRRAASEGFDLPAPNDVIGSSEALPRTEKCVLVWVPEKAQ